MNHLEAYNILKNRVEWRNPLNTGFSYLVFNEPLSGRYLQEEHISVRIPIIYETIVDVDITPTQFQNELEENKKRSILHLLQDVFYDCKEIDESFIKADSSLFDYAIILKNTISVLSDILNSTRINNTNKVSEENLKRWFIDLNGLKDPTNGVFVKGFISRYSREIEKIRKVIFKTNTKLLTITMG